MFPISWNSDPASVSTARAWLICASARLTWPSSISDMAELQRSS